MTVSKWAKRDRWMTPKERFERDKKALQRYFERLERKGYKLPESPADYYIGPKERRR